ncbi:putative isochorismatase (phenazine biosynthesis) PhzD [Streptomyces spiroverticillatus]|uniref:Isochorismatase (Phenazine biosynthesis) PhzD n=1 Tax=Streptomyces finlayi TaxID=67296 RepID=A0A918X4D8_9ACTN|nr:isochorismatase family protein [Streptomyces finlayi]GHA31736.1 putative isochorismatase (phenazine biosynthesis) PhzD [Streptomyces spiroverticillatus]GHD10922.1 putative isochorismatase (phenazine biosynthesis) PhzD [Streptomyces finlayi]
MAIPLIDSYPMPTEAELPLNTAPWTIDPDRAVLLVHDLQNYFLHPFGHGGPDAGRQPLTDLMDHAEALRRQFTAVGAPVVYTAQPGGMSDGDRGLLKDIWGAGMSADEEHRAIPDRIAPAPGEQVFTKWRPSAFCRTDLLDTLRRSGRDQLVICGVYAHVGILMTAHEGFSHDIQTFVVGDAIADFSARRHQETLEYVATRCSVTLSTRAVLAAMGGGRP